MNNTFSVQNIIDGQAIGVSITGMSIVFVGLLLISIYIALLPYILDKLKRKPKTTKIEKIATKEPAEAEEKVVEAPAKPAVAASKAIHDESNDIASVIGIVLQLEHERITKSENEQITIKRDSNQPSMWGSAGKMRKIPQRRTHA